MSFSLNIYSPTRALVKSLRVKELVVPTTQGEINILPGHTHIVGQLDTGVLLAKGEDNQDHHYLVTTGVCKVLNNEVVVLSRVCESADDIDQQRAEKALKNAEGKLLSGSTLGEQEIQKFSRKRDRAKVRLMLSLLKKKK